VDCRENVLNLDKYISLLVRVSWTEYRMYGCGHAKSTFVSYFGQLLFAARMTYAVRALAYERGRRKKFLCLQQRPAQHRGSPNPTVQGVLQSSSPGGKSGGAWS